MNRTISFLLVFALLSGCGPKALTPEDISRENKAIGVVVATFWRAYESKNWSAMNRLFTAFGEFFCYGADSVVGTKAPWLPSGYEAAFPTVTLGQISKASILLLDSRGELASVTCQIQVNMEAGGARTPTLARYAAALRKEDGEWRILHCMAAFPVCHPSVGRLAKLQGMEPRETGK